MDKGTRISLLIVALVMFSFLTGHKIGRDSVKYQRTLDLENFEIYNKEDIIEKDNIIKNIKKLNEKYEDIIKMCVEKGD